MSYNPAAFGTDNAFAHLIPQANEPAPTPMEAVVESPAPEEDGPVNPVAAPSGWGAPAAPSGETAESIAASNAAFLSEPAAAPVEAVVESPVPVVETPAAPPIPAPVEYVAEQPAPVQAPPAPVVTPAPVMAPTPTEFTGGEFYDHIEECIAFAETRPLFGDSSPTSEPHRFSAASRKAIHQVIERLFDHDCTEVLLTAPNDVSVRIGGKIVDVSDTFVDGSGRPSGNDYTHFLNEILIAQFTDSARRIGDGSVDIEADFVADIDEIDETTGEAIYAPIRARLNIVCPPLSEFAIVTAAKKARVGYTLDRMVGNGTMTPQMANLLASAAKAGLTIIVSGGSGSGKTTLLQALGQYFPEGERVALIEDRKEIMFPATVRVIPFGFDRDAGPSDKGSLAWAINNTTRMRVSRAVVGETIGYGFAEFCNVANSGITGCMTTIHANEPRKALDKMEKLYGGKDDSRMAVVKDIARTVDLIVQMRLENGRHAVVNIEQVMPTVTDSGVIATESLYEYVDGQFRHTGRLNDETLSFLRDEGIPIEKLEASRRPVN